MLPRTPSSYEDACRRFRWQVPARYNIGADVCTRWAEREPARLALVAVDADGHAREYGFGAIHEGSNRLGNLLRAHGAQRGDRIGILLPQALETALAHLACYKLGCIAVPLFTLFGVDALRYRLHDSGARVVVTNGEGAAKLAGIRDQLPALQVVFSVDGAGPGVLDLQPALRAQASDLQPVDTAAEDPAVIIYTSGTTGQPKGALHAHRVLLGHLPGVEISHDLLPQAGDRLWTPADWAWIGGLFDVLLPAWHHGVPVVANRLRKFSAEAAFELLQDHGVRNAFLPPTALKLMRAVPEPQRRWRYRLRSVASGGEPLGAELLDWGRRAFGLTINEFYGQTECNMTVSACAALMPARPGAIGKPVPGHRLAVIDAAGTELPAGELGQIAVQRPDPVLFLRYWNNEPATHAKFVGDWLLTGDTGRFDADGYLHFVGRADDLITSAGYRIGPGEIEDCILQHPAVRMAAVVGAPDPQRTEVVVAVIVVQDGVRADDELARSIQAHVKQRLAAHEYPRELYFVDELPLTTTGKVVRRSLREQVAQWRAAR